MGKRLMKIIEQQKQIARILTISPITVKAINKLIITVRQWMIGMITCLFVVPARDRKC